MKIATTKPKQGWILQLELQLPYDHMKMYSYDMPMASASLILLNILPERGPDEIAAIPGRDCSGRMLDRLQPPQEYGQL
jgi:hypothetical protein